MIEERAPRADWQGNFAWDADADRLLQEKFNLQHFRLPSLSWHQQPPLIIVAYLITLSEQDHGAYSVRILSSLTWLYTDMRYGCKYKFVPWTTLPILGPHNRENAQKMGFQCEWTDTPLTNDLPDLFKNTSYLVEMVFRVSLAGSSSACPSALHVNSASRLCVELSGP